MATWDSADLLSRLKATLARGTTIAETDASLYVLLSNGQQRIAQMLAAMCPWTQVAAPELLTTTDSGVTYTTASYPLGHLELYDGLAGPQILPIGYGQNTWDGYVLEGQTIRWPGDRARTFGNGLYARYVATPTVIDGSTAPTLKPSYARQGIVYAAAEEFAHQGGAMDPSPYTAMLQKFLWGDPRNPGATGLIAALQTQAAGIGHGAAVTAGGAWWRGNGWSQGS